MSTQTRSSEIQRIGQALKQAERTGNSEVQIRLYQKLLRLTPDLPAAHAQLAHLYFEQGQDDLAKQHVEHVLAGDHDPALDQIVFPHLYKRPAYQADVKQSKAWYAKGMSLARFKLLYLGLVDQHGNAHEEAEGILHDALNHITQPTEQAQLMTLLGQLYHRMARFHDAIACYQLGLQMTPGNPTQLLNMAVALEQVGRYREALGYYKQLLEKDPDHPAVNNNIAINLLRMGEFEAGWPRYEWRWPAAHREHYQQFSIPRWSGQSLEGKTLLVWAEQGIGDHIMFASILNELREIAKALHYEIYDRLVTLFKRSFPEVNFVRRELQGEREISGEKLFQQSWPRSDYQIPIGSLPALFRPNRESFKGRSPYLLADPEQSQALRSEYQQLFPGKRLIGISWRGGKTFNTEKQSRHIGFGHLATLARQPNVQLIDLQYDSTAQDRALAAQHGVQLFHDERIDPGVDMDPQASQIVALDAVVSVDNTTVHLAGALGVPTYALLPLNPNWRWGIHGDRAYWYDSVQLFRSPTLGDWETPISQLIDALQADGLLSPVAPERGAQS